MNNDDLVQFTPGRSSVRGQGGYKMMPITVNMCNNLVLMCVCGGVGQCGGVGS